LHKNAFGGRAEPGSAGGAIALSQTVIRGRGGEGKGRKGLGMGRGGKDVKGWGWTGREGEGRDGKEVGWKGRGREDREGEGARLGYFVHGPVTPLLSAAKTLRQKLSFHLVIMRGPGLDAFARNKLRSSCAQCAALTDFICIHTRTQCMHGGGGGGGGGSGGGQAQCPPEIRCYYCQLPTTSRLKDLRRLR